MALVDEDVAQGEVAVHEAGRVERRQPAQGLQQELDPAARSQRAGGDRVQQGAVLARRDGQVVVGDRRRDEDRQHVRVAEPGDHRHVRQHRRVVAPRDLVGAQLIEVLGVEDLADRGAVAVAHAEQEGVAHAAVPDVLAGGAVALPVLDEHESGALQIGRPERGQCDRVRADFAQVHRALLWRSTRVAAMRSTRLDRARSQHREWWPELAMWTACNRPIAPSIQSVSLGR